LWRGRLWRRRPSLEVGPYKNMNRIRFATIQSLFESYPEALENIRVEPTDEPPIAFVNRLVAQGKPDEALEVFAYLLPRREAVWWGCASVRKLLGGSLPSDITGLAAAEAWVQEPSEENRQRALDIGDKAPSHESLTWLAWAVGWSNGNFAGTPFPYPPFMTSRAVRIALLIAMRRVNSDERAKLLQACLADGIRLAEAGP
jgi:hypothetical protein